MSSFLIKFNSRLLHHLSRLDLPAIVSPSLAVMRFLLLIASSLLLSVSQGSSLEFPGGMDGGNQPCYDTEQDGVTVGERPFLTISRLLLSVCHFLQGWCEHTACCAYDYYISDLCPNYPNNVKCCYSHNECAAECTNPVSSTVQRLACDILDLYENGRIWLKPEHFNDQGNNPYDGAASLSNIRDTCIKGTWVKRCNPYYVRYPGK